MLRHPASSGSPLGAPSASAARPGPVVIVAALDFPRPSAERSSTGPEPTLLRSGNNSAAGSHVGLFERSARTQILPKPNRRSTPCGRISYTWNVQAHWRESIVGEHGELLLAGLPFDPGQLVEVLVVSRKTPSTAVPGRTLRGSVLEYHDPLDPVASDEWDALR